MLRAFYFFFAGLICIGLLCLGLWPWAIKPRANAWVSEKVRQIGEAHGLLVRTGEISILSYDEIEITSTRVDDPQKQWSIQAPRVTVEISYLALWLGKQPLRKIRLKDPRVIASVPGSTGNDFHFQSPQTLKELVIENGHLHIEDPTNHGAIRVSQLYLSIKKKYGNYNVSARSPLIWLQRENQSIDVNSLYFRGVFQDGQLRKQVEIQDLEIEAPQGRISVDGKLILDKYFHLHEKSALNFHAQANLRRLIEPYASGTYFDGVLFAKGSLGLKAKSKALWARGAVGVRELEIDDVNIDLIDAKFNVENNMISLSQIEALFGNSLVRGDAVIEPKKDWHVAVSGQTQNLSLYGMLVDIGVKPSFVDLEINARLQAQGKLWPEFSLKGSVQGQAEKFFVANRSAKRARNEDIILRVPGAISVNSKIDIDANAFRFRDAIVSDGITSGNVQCTLNFEKKKGLYIEAASDLFDFRSIGEKIGDERYKGTGRLVATVSGPYDDIHIDAESTLARFVFEGVDFGRIGGRIHYEGDDLSFVAMDGSTEHANYRGDMTIRFLDDITMDLKLHEMKATLPEAFTMLKGSRFQHYAAPLVERETHGTFDGNLEIQGPIEATKRQDLQGSLHLRFPKGITVDKVALNSLEFSGSATKGDWLIESMLARIGSGSATLTGAVRKKDRASTLSLKAEHIPLAALHSAINIPELAGRLDAAIEMTNTLDKPSFAGVIEVADVETSQWRLGHQKVILASENDKGVRLSGALLSGAAQIDGHLQLDDRLSFNARLKWPFTPLSNFAKEGVLPFGAVAEMGGTVDLAGDLMSMKLQTAQIGLYPVAVQVFNRRWLSAGELKIGWTPTSSLLQRFFFKTAQGDQLRINGEWNHQNSHLDILGAMDLDAFQLAHDDFEVVRGLLNARIRLSGDISDPILTGQVEVHDGYFVHSQFSDPIEDLSAKFSFNGKEVELSGLKGRASRGFVEGYGRAHLKNYKASELESHFLFKYFPFQVNNLISGVATGFLDYRQLKGELSLAGDLKVRDGYVATSFKPEDFRIQSKLGSFGLVPIRMDVRVRSDDPIKVDTEMITGELEGNLHLIGTHLKPGLQGSMELKSGKATFRNHNYQLTKARIDFDDAYRIIPRLDVLAHGEIRDYLVHVHLQGTPEHPKFRLTSEPYLPESQLLILASLGYATQDMTAQMAGLEAISLYSGLGRNVTRFLNQHGSTRYFQVDELSLSSLFSKSEGVSRPAVRVGMNVWSGLRLKLQTALTENKGKREQRVELEQSLGRQLKWRLGWDSEGPSNYGDPGADLWYRWELE